MTEDRTDLPELPRGWAWTTVDQIGQLLRGVTYKKHEASKDGKHGSVPILRANNINSELNFDDLVYVPLERVKDEQFVKAGDIVICMSSGSKRLVGKAAQAKDQFPGGFGAFCGLVRVSDPMDRKYPGFFFQGPTYRKSISELSTGVNINNLRRDHIESMPVPVAPLLEQQRIVAKIEELFSQLDAGVEALENAKAQLQRYRQAVLKAAMEGELTKEWREAHKGELEPASVLLQRILDERRTKWEAQQLEKMRAKGKVPKSDKLKGKYREPAAPDTSGLPDLPGGWAWATLEQIARDRLIGVVRSLKQQNKEGRGAAYIKMNNVTMTGYVTLDNLVFVKVSDDELRHYGVRKGDVLFNTRNSLELVGKTGLVRHDAKDTVYNNNLMRIRTASGVSSGFLVCQMCSNTFRGRMEKAKRATTNVAALYAKDVLPLPVAVPPMLEQIAIVDEAERRLSLIDDLASIANESLRRAERLRQSILKRAFEGRLVPQDPTDEPASLLLERIKAEKAKRETEKRTRKKRPRKDTPEQLELI